MSTATERVYRTTDGRYVPHGHEDAAFLVAGVGGTLPADFTGFSDDPAPAAQAPVEPVEEAPAGEVADPAEDAPADPEQPPAKPAKTKKP